MPTLQEAIQKYEAAVNATKTSTNSIEVVYNEHYAKILEYLKGLKLEGFTIDKRGQYGNENITFTYNGLKDASYSIRDTYKLLSGWGTSRQNPSKLTGEDIINKILYISFDKPSFKTVPHQFSGGGSIESFEKSATDAGVKDHATYMDNGAKAWKAKGLFVEELVKQTQFWDTLADICNAALDEIRSDDLKDASRALRQEVAIAKDELTTALNEEIMTVMSSPVKFPELSFSELDAAWNKWGRICKVAGHHYSSSVEQSGWDSRSMKRDAPNTKRLPLFFNQKEKYSFQGQELTIDKINAKSVRVHVKEPKPDTTEFDTKEYDGHRGIPSSFGKGRSWDFPTQSQGRYSKVLTTQKRLVSLYVLYVAKQKPIAGLDAIVKLSEKF